MTRVIKTATTSRKKKTQKTKVRLKAEAKHNKWLRKRGVHPDQLAIARKKNKLENIKGLPDEKYSEDV